MDKYTREPLTYSKTQTEIHFIQYVFHCYPMMAEVARLDSLYEQMSYQLSLHVG